jgi:hypothetical protein
MNTVDEAVVVADAVETGWGSLVLLISISEPSR